MMRKLMDLLNKRKRKATGGKYEDRRHSASMIYDRKAIMR